MKTYISIAIAAIGMVAVGPLPAAGDVIVGTGAWQPWSASDVNENRTPYWDGNSYDSDSVCNIGTFIAGTAPPGCNQLASGSPNQELPYWGVGGGAADLNFYFHRTLTAHQATLLIEVAGFEDSNVFGWYDQSTGALNPIFVGLDSPITTREVVITADNYGFYLVSPHGTFWTESSRNVPADLTQRFAVFSGTDGAYWIGIEDLQHAVSDWDYQDMIVKVQAVPEPASLLLLGSGLAGIAAARRRRGRAAAR